MPVLSQHCEYLVLDCSELRLVLRKFSINLVIVPWKRSGCISRPHGGMADSRCEETMICSTGVRGQIQNGAYSKRGLAGKGVLWLHSSIGKLRLGRSWRSVISCLQNPNPRKIVVLIQTGTMPDQVLGFPRTKANQRTTHRWTLSLPR